MIIIFRINDMIDLPVIDGITSKRLSTIHDVIIDLRENKVYALICNERLLKRSLEAVFFDNVLLISQNSVAVDGRINLISLRELSMKHRRFQSYENILGKIILSSRGETLGIIRDILIDVNSGIIKAYELSEGYIDDFLVGRHIIELDKGHILFDKNVPMKANNTYYFCNTK